MGSKTRRVQGKVESIKEGEGGARYIYIKKKDYSGQLSSKGVLVPRADVNKTRRILMFHLT